MTPAVIAVAAMSLTALVFALLYVDCARKLAQAIEIGQEQNATLETMNQACEALRARLAAREQDIERLLHDGLEWRSPDGRTVLAVTTPKPASFAAILSEEGAKP